MTSADNPIDEGKKKLAEEQFKSSIEHVTEDDVSSAASSGLEKIEKLSKSKPQALLALWDDLVLLVRMLGDYVTGKYREVPFRSIAAVAVAVLYFVSPIDVIPDFIPLAGYTDDAVVLALCLRMVHDDIQAYREWRTKNG